MKNLLDFEVLKDVINEENGDFVFDFQKKYSLAVYGKTCFSSSEWNSMSENRKYFIIDTYKKAQAEINLLKQRLIIEYSNDILRRFYGDTFELLNSINKPNSALFVDDWSLAKSYFVENISLKDLGITKKHVAALLINKGIIEK